jgi:hypothetical protein
VGTDGGDTKGVHSAKSFEVLASSYLPEPQSESTAALEPGRKLLHSLWEEAAPRSLTLVVIASLKDAALLISCPTRNRIGRKSKPKEQESQLITSRVFLPWRSLHPARAVTRCASLSCDGLRNSVTCSSLRRCRFPCRAFFLLVGSHDCLSAPSP